MQMIRRATERVPGVFFDADGGAGGGEGGDDAAAAAAKAAAAGGDDAAAAAAKAAAAADGGGGTVLTGGAGGGGDDAAAVAAAAAAAAGGDDAAAAAAAKAAAAAAGAPEKYELTVPEGSFEATLFEAAQAKFKEANLTNDQAQAVVNIQLEAQERAAQARNAERDGWVNTIKTDPKMGGVNYDATIAKGRAVVHWFGAEFAKLLDTTHLGDNPVMMAAMLRVHEKIGEGSLSADAGGAGVGDAPKDAASALYKTVDVVRPEAQTG